MSEELGYHSRIVSFGDVAAEQDDAVLSYFLKTEAVTEIESGKRLLVLGRKGSGKTALARYFSESTGHGLATSLSLRDYPWNLHKTRRNLGASEIESYVSSWRYLLAVKANATLLEQRGMKQMTDAQRAANRFLLDNYGSASPTLSDVLRPKRLKLTKFSFQPSVMGNAVGGVDFETATGGVAPEIDALTDVLLDNAHTIGSQVGVDRIFLHLDELDQGLSTLDESHQQMVVGLILAARQVAANSAHGVCVNPVIYLRTDIWDELRFSDKNKISQSSAILLEWTPNSLLDMINERIKYKLGGNLNWNDIEDGALMRGSQTKWNHIINRTFMRPRDVIQFLNFALEIS